MEKLEANNIFVAKQQIVTINYLAKNLWKINGKGGKLFNTDNRKCAKKLSVLFLVIGSINMQNQNYSLPFGIIK